MIKPRVGLLLILTLSCVICRHTYETIGIFEGTVVNGLGMFIGSATTINGQQAPNVVVSGQFSFVSWTDDNGNRQTIPASGLALYNDIKNTWSTLKGLDGGIGVAEPRQQASLVLQNPKNNGSLFLGGWFAYAGNHVPNTMGAAQWSAKEGYTSMGDGLDVLQNNVPCWGATDDAWMFRAFPMGNGSILSVGRFGLGDASSIGVWDGKHWSSIGKGVRSTCDVSALHNFGEVHWVYDASFDDSNGDIYFMGEFTFGIEDDGTHVPSVGLIKRNVAANKWESIPRGIANCANQPEPLDWLFRPSIARVNNSLYIGGAIRPFKQFPDTCNPQFRVFKLVDGEEDWQDVHDGVLNGYDTGIYNGNAVFLFMRHLKEYKNPSLALSFTQDVMTTLISNDFISRVTSVNFLDVGTNFIQVWLGGFQNTDKDSQSVIVRCVDCILK